jgi:hypothetical protein
VGVKDAIGIPVKCAGPDIELRGLFDALAEFGRGELREGNRRYLARVYTVLQQVHDAVAQHAGLATAGACLDDDRGGIDSEFYDRSLRE